MKIIMLINVEVKPTFISMIKTIFQEFESKENIFQQISFYEPQF